jgi:hypothetical protein
VLQFSLNAPVAPGRILLGEPDDEPANLRWLWWSARSSRIGPAPAPRAYGASAGSSQGGRTLRPSALSEELGWRLQAGAGRAPGGVAVSPGDSGREVDGGER